MKKHPTHTTDEKAQAILKDAFATDDWILYGISPDYGKDSLVEIVEKDQAPSGEDFFLQLKGSATHFRVRDDKITFALKVKDLTYWNKHKRPVFLVVIDVQTKQGFWLFIQKYLREGLAEKKWDSGKTVSVRIPVANNLKDHATLREAVRNAIRYLAESDPSILDPQFDQARAFLENHDPVTAQKLLNNLDTHLPAQLSPALQARRLGLRASCEAQLGHAEEAAKLHLRASETNPDPVEAARQRILASVARNDSAKIRELCDIAHAQFPLAARLTGLWVETLPPTTPLEQIEKEIPRELVSDVHVLLGLSGAATQRRDFASAIRFARTALTISPTSTLAKAALAEAVGYRASQGKPPLPSEVPEIREAVEIFRELLRSTPDESRRKWNFHLLHGMLLRVLGPIQAKFPAVYAILFEK